MITMTKNPVIPNFSFIEKNTFGKVFTVNHPVGEEIKNSFYLLCNKYSGDVKIIKNVIMPDHIHFIFFLKRDLNKHLSDFMSEFMGTCSRRLWNLPQFSALAEKREPVFEAGYHDRILLRKGQLRNMMRYINDNPRRLYYRRRHSDLFKERYILEIGGEKYETMGNIFLLDDPDKMVVKASRNWTENDFERNKMKWFQCVSNSGVLVSPFIHKYEKEGLKGAMDLDGKIIYVLTNGFGDREYPKGRFFDHCAAGNILFITPLYHIKTTVKLRRERCREMNELSKTIAETDPREFKFSRK